MTVSAPRTGFTQTVYLEPGAESISVSIPKNVQADAASARYNGGILVTANSDIRMTVAQQFAGRPISSYLAYPIDALSNSYYASTYYEPGYHFNIGVLATVGQTRVIISLPSNNDGVQFVYNGITYTDGQQIELVLDELEALQLTDFNNANIRQALLIQADRPIAVFVANKDVPDFEEVQGLTDTMTSQIPPLRSLGTTFHIARAPGRSIEESVVMQAVRDGTMVRVSDQQNDVLLNEAEMSFFTITGDSIIR